VFPVNAFLLFSPSIAVSGCYRKTASAASTLYQHWWISPVDLGEREVDTSSLPIPTPLGTKKNNTFNQQETRNANRDSAKARRIY
jgi:hypothetical protein